MDRLQGKETSAAQRETIITLHEAEVPVREISRRLNIPKRTVHRWIKLQKERGTLRSMPRSGAPRCTTSEQDQLIIATVQQQPLTNAVEIKQKLGLTVGVQTVRNRLNKLAQWKQLRCYETYVPHRPKNQQKKMTQKSVTLESAVQVKQVTDQRNGKQSEVKTEVMEDIEHQEMEGNEDLNQRNDRPSSVKTEVIEDFDQMNNSDVQTETIKNFDQKNCNTVKTERTENFGPDFANFSDQYNQSQLYCDVIEIEKEEYDFDFVEVSDEQQGKGENSNNIEITQRKFKGVKRKFDPSINLSSSDMEFSKEEEYEDFDPLTVDSDDIQVMQLRRKNYIMTGYHDTEILIAEVQKRPVLWDSSAEDYKDKNRKMEAWVEVCHSLIEDYGEKSMTDKNNIGKEVQARWRSIRDSYKKDYKKHNNESKSGSRAVKSHHYVFSEQLSFLRKVMVNRSTTNILSSAKDTKVVTEDAQDFVIGQSAACSRPTNKKKSISLEERRKFVNGIEEQDDEDKDFFMSMLPTLRTLNKEQKMEFRLQVKLALRNIKAGCGRGPITP